VNPTRIHPTPTTPIRRSGRRSAVHSITGVKALEMVVTSPIRESYPQTKAQRHFTTLRYQRANISGRGRAYRAVGRGIDQAPGEPRPRRSRIIQRRPDTGSVRHRLSDRDQQSKGNAEGRSKLIAHPNRIAGASNRAHHRIEPDAGYGFVKRRAGILPRERDPMRRAACQAEHRP
jgi:hypothetical protein